MGMFKHERKLEMLQRNKRITLDKRSGFSEGKIKGPSPWGGQSVVCTSCFAPLAGSGLRRDFPQTIGFAHVLQRRTTESSVRSTP